MFQRRFNRVHKDFTVAFCLVQVQTTVDELHESLPFLRVIITACNTDARCIPPPNLKLPEQASTTAVVVIGTTPARKVTFPQAGKVFFYAVASEGELDLLFLRSAPGVAFFANKLALAQRQVEENLRSLVAVLDETDTCDVV